MESEQEQEQKQLYLRKEILEQKYFFYFYI